MEKERDFYASYEAFTAHLGDREYFGQKLGLERIQKLLDRLGHPERRFKSIHIAGTNGKGSTAAMIASILREAGFKVGLYTSPHLVDFCERIQIGEMKIFPEEVLQKARQIREVEEERLTFFELATAIAFLHFASERVDFAVIETGLGGRLDATNVITPLVSIITTIGKDHTSHLGNTIEEIAFEKAGIIKPNIPVIVGPLLPEAMGVVREIAFLRNARLITPPMDRIPLRRPLGLPGRHQYRNANLSFAVTQFLREIAEIHISDEMIFRGLENVVWPGRLETISERPWILLDGAHNPEAMRVVREYLEENLNGRKLKVLFGSMADKDIKSVFEEIAPLASEFLLTAPQLKRASRPEDLAFLLRKFSVPTFVFPDVSSALSEELPKLEVQDVLLITGSLFIVGEARLWLEEKIKF
jgi:dihydrofolate synthase/folylpolyglutamate synthase